MWPKRRCRLTTGSSGRARSTSESILGRVGPDPVTTLHRAPAGRVATIRPISVIQSVDVPVSRSAQSVSNQEGAVLVVSIAEVLECPADGRLVELPVAAEKRCEGVGVPPLEGFGEPRFSDR